MLSRASLADANALQLPLAAAEPSSRRKGRVLLVTDRIVWPINSGNTLRTWNFIRALHGHYELSLIHPCRTAPDREALSHVAPYFSRIWSIPDDGRRAADTFRQSVGNKLRRVPWEIARSHRPLFAEAVARVLGEERFDVVLARYIYQARYLFDWAGKIPGRLVVDVDDIETLKMRRLQGLAPGRSRGEQFRLAVNNWIFAQYHKRSLPLADLCIVCSDEDRRYLLTHGWAKNVAVVPNAVEADRYAVGGRAPRGRTLLFCGVLNYEPNVDGIRWFVRDVLPHIRRREPAVSVLIVGRHAADEIRALAQDPSISLHEDVPDVAPYYERASAVIVPIRSGSGTRLKVLEAGACHRPVVSTAIGVEGLRMIPDRHCLIDDDPEGFAAKCVDVLQDEQKAGRLAEELYDFVKSTYDAPRVQDGVRDLFEPLATGH